MNKQILKIEPVYEPRLWGGKSRLKEEFHYETDVQPLGEVYNVVALKGRQDCWIESLDITLSDLYEQQPSWFECDTKELPIRVNILDPLLDLSVQLHPDDDYALTYNGGRGKPECWVILESPGKTIQLGHYARSLDEFKQLTKEGRWEELLRYVEVETGDFIDLPSGTLHAIGEGVLTYNISRNAECTFRLYDYDRIEKSTGSLRELHVQEVFDNVLIPDYQNQPVRSNITHEHTYWDEPGLYTLTRLKVNHEQCYEQERFMFITCVNGEGHLNNLPIRKGDTYFVPHQYGEITLKGTLDLMIASYKNKGVHK